VTWFVSNSSRNENIKAKKCFKKTDCFSVTATVLGAGIGKVLPTGAFDLFLAVLRCSLRSTLLRSPFYNPETKNSCLLQAPFVSDARDNPPTICYPGPTVKAQYINITKSMSVAFLVFCPRNLQSETAFIIVKTTRCCTPNRLNFSKTMFKFTIRCSLLIAIFS